MKQNIFKVVSLSLLMLASFILTSLSKAQSSPDQTGTTTTAQSAPAEKTVEQVFKNIKVLNGMPQSKLYPTMRFMAASLGFQCGSCHVIKNGFVDASADDKPEKQTARDMIRMVLYINKNYAEGNPTVSCYTCHRGHRTPQGAPVLPLPIPSQGSPNASAASLKSPGTQQELPSVDEVLNRYLVAIGGKAATDRITSCVVKGTTTTAIGQVVAYNAETATPDKGHEVFTLPDASGRSCAGDSRCEYERVISGRHGWLKSGAGVQELVGEQFGDQKLSFPLFMILKLKDQFSSTQLSGQDRIDGHDVYVVNAIRFDNKRERLYFDAENGLLRRRISYMRTFIATIPQQTDFQDYREVEGLKLPFTITVSSVDLGSVPITRKFAEIKINVPLSESRFNKPSP